MRHLKRGRHLGRTSSHRRAMLRNMAISLFRHGKIVTTPEKAKETRPFAERLITLAKRGDFSAKRRAIRLLHDPKIVTALFEQFGPRFKDRPGGYTRILHMERRRIGDGARLALFELVGDEIRGGKAKAKKPTAVTVDHAAPAQAAPAAVEVEEETPVEATAEPMQEQDAPDKSEA